MNRKIRLGHFAPLAGPEQTGVADYARALERALSTTDSIARSTIAPLHNPES
jgi:hypothetical protein